MRRLLAACLAGWLGAACAWALEPVEPVAPETPTPDAARKEVDRRVGPRVRQAQATETPDDDVALARQLLEEARTETTPQSRALLLDEVVRVGSPCHKAQALVYQALRMQKQWGLRPARPCLERMMAVGPRVDQDLAGQALADWFQGLWVPDAAELADTQISRQDFAAALVTMQPVKDFAAKHRLVFVPHVQQKIDALVAMKELTDTLDRYEQAVRQPGDHARESVCLGLYALLVRSDREVGLERLRASQDSSARTVAELWNATLKPSRQPKDVATVAGHLVVLADQTDSPSLNLIVLARAERDFAACLSRDDVAGAERQQLEAKHAATLQLCDVAATKAPPGLRQLIPALRRDADAPPPAADAAIPKEDLDRLKRLIDYLATKISPTCIECKGRGSSTRVENVPATPFSAARRVTITSKCGNCNGGGRTPYQRVQPTIEAIRKILDQFGDKVPSDVRTAADAAIAKFPKS